MNFASKATSLQSYHMLLYRKALHPEFFGIEGRRRIEHGEYEFESWIFRGGHCFLFQFAGTCIAEIVTDRIAPLPAKGLIVTLPCAGERDHEEKVSDRVEVVTSIQTETLTDHLYVSIYNEMLEHGRASVQSRSNASVACALQTSVPEPTCAGSGTPPEQSFLQTTAIA